MEDPIYKNSSTESQNESVGLSVDKKGLFNSLKDISSESRGDLETIIKDESKKEINGFIDISCVTPTGCESLQLSELVKQKTCSPTLIESAFQVMKNLFSPEKIKSKSASFISPSNNLLNASESPNISSNIFGKAELFALEPENNSRSNAQFVPGENGFKNCSQNNESEMLQTPLTLDPLNNTDESFMTTVSLIDESFHSAVTNLDEHGEFLKNCTNLKDNILNNSRNSDLIDPSNDTLENNDSCLENTTLKIDNFSSDGTKLASIENKDEFIKSFSGAQVDGENSHLNGSEKVTESQAQYDFSYCAKSENCSKNEFLEHLTEINFKKEAAAIQNVGCQDSFTKTSLPSDITHEIQNSVENSEISDLYLNKSLAKQTPVEQNKIFSNVIDEKILKERGEKFNIVEREIDNQNEILLENDEGNCVANSISTTTIVLNTGESVDLESMLMSLKEDGSSTNLSTFTCEGDDAICSLDNEIPQSDTSISILTNDFVIPQQRRLCFSEGNSPNRSEFPKAKLNKSDELLNRRIFAESFEKNLRDDNSIADLSLMKYSEASKISKKSENFKQPSGTESTKVDTPSKTTDPIAIVSQQSYTILTVHDKSLNRPVIESLNVSDDVPKQQQAFQKNDSDAKLSTELGVAEMGFGNNSSNGSFDSEDLVKSTQLKQSTPLWEGNNETSGKIFRPISLKLHSPEITESVSDEAKIEILGERDLSCKKAKQIFSSNETVDGFSPVNPNDVTKISFGNYVENEVDMNHQDVEDQNKIKQTPGVKSRSKKSTEDTNESPVQKLNQSSDKKQQSLRSKNQPSNEKSEPRASHPLNQTFEKKLKSPVSNNKNRSLNEQSQTPKQDKFNITFDISTKSSNSNKTFTKETRSPEIGEANLTFNKSESPELPLLNKTYDKPVNNQLNHTYSKKAESPGPQKFNETFDKESVSPGKTIQVSDEKVESLSRNESNQTFVLDDNQLEKIQELNQTNEIIDIEKTNISKVDILEEKIIEANNTFQVPPTNESQPHTSGFPSTATLQYRNTNNIESGSHSEANDSFVSTKSSNTSLFCSDISTVVLNEEDNLGNRSIDDLSRKLGKIDLNENSKKDTELSCTPNVSFSDGTFLLKEIVQDQNLQTEENSLNSFKDDKLRCDPDLVQLIREQFSSNDIEKICSVVQDLSSAKLTNDILKASEHFDKSFHGNPSEVECKFLEVESDKEKAINALSPQSFDFLNSVGGKPTGRDLSRESLYVKFDPLVQPSANSLIDFTKEGEALAAIDASPVSAHSSSICEQLLTISPQKKPDAIVPPLTPLSHKNKADSKEDKLERLKELQNEIYFLKNLYAERERSNKTKMEEYENQIAKLTGEGCMLEDKLKESNEREKSLVKKIKEQTQSIGQLKVIMEEYVKVISKLSSELEAIKNENSKQLETLSLEKDSYMTHLQNTEAAFTDVHAKYEKSKKTIVNLKANEVLYRNTIAEQAQKIEEFRSRAKEAQEKALVAFQKIQEELNQTKASHSQEAARLKAQLRKTELKVEALQESLEQKIKENQQLTAICDELIEGKK